MRMKLGQDINQGTANAVGIAATAVGCVGDLVDTGNGRDRTALVGVLHKRRGQRVVGLRHSADRDVGAVRSDANIHELSLGGLTDACKGAAHG